MLHSHLCVIHLFDMKKLMAIIMPILGTMKGGGLLILSEGPCITWPAGSIVQSIGRSTNQNPHLPGGYLSCCELFEKLMYRISKHVSKSTNTTLFIHHFTLLYSPTTNAAAPTARAPTAISTLPAAAPPWPLSPLALVSCDPDPPLVLLVGDDESEDVPVPGKMSAHLSYLSKHPQITLLSAAAPHHILPQDAQLASHVAPQLHSSCVWPAPVALSWVSSSSPEPLLEPLPDPLPLPEPEPLPLSEPPSPPEPVPLPEPLPEPLPDPLPLPEPSALPLEQLPSLAWHTQLLLSGSYVPHHGVPQSLQASSQEVPDPQTCLLSSASSESTWKISRSIIAYDLIAVTLRASLVIARRGSRDATTRGRVENFILNSGLVFSGEERLEIGQEEDNKEGVLGKERCWIATVVW